MLDDPTYWTVVAEGIDVEDKKMNIFVPHHKHSRGIAREAILRSLLVAHTPHPFVISTGFVHDDSPYRVEPKQCDVLVYDPRDGQPYYRLDEFVGICLPSIQVALGSPPGDLLVPESGRWCCTERPRPGRFPYV